MVAFFSDGSIIFALWIIYNDFFVAVIAFQKQVKRSQDIKFSYILCNNVLQFFYCEMLCDMDATLQNEWKLKKWCHGMAWIKVTQ